MTEQVILFNSVAFISAALSAAAVKTQRPLHRLLRNHHKNCVSKGKANTFAGTKERHYSTAL